MIAPRQLLIDALQERKDRWPTPPPSRLVGEVGRDVVAHRLRETPRKAEEWYSRGPIVQLNHPSGNDTGDYGIVGGRHLIKAHGQIQAIEIPHWGRATDIAAIYNDAVLEKHSVTNR